LSTGVLVEAKDAEKFCEIAQMRLISILNALCVIEAVDAPTEVFGSLGETRCPTVSKPRHFALNEHNSVLREEKRKRRHRLGIDLVIGRKDSLLGASDRPLGSRRVRRARKRGERLVDNWRSQ